MDDTTEDTLLDGRVRLRQPRTGFRAAIDPVLLAAFIPARPGEHVLELGCGSGAAFLCLAARVPGLVVTALEQDASLAELARQNAGANGVAAQVLCNDLRRMAPLHKLHHAFANPPYFRGGTPPTGTARHQAMQEAAPLSDWVRVMAAALRPRGTLSLVLPAARWDEGAALLRTHGLGSVLIWPLWPRAGLPARRVMLRGIKGGRGPGRIGPGTVLHQDEGFTAAADEILRGGAALACQR